MSIKNPNNIITLDDDITANIAVNGQYYPDTRMRYPEEAVLVRCDRCGKCPLACCVGLDTTDLCLECVELTRTQTLSVKDLETSSGITQEYQESFQAKREEEYRSGMSQIEDSMTELELHSQYMMSDIQRGQLELLYESLAEHKTNSFRLTCSESAEIMNQLFLIYSFNMGRKWLSEDDRMIHPRYQRNPPVPDSAPGSGLETPQEPSLQESPDSIDKIK